MKQFRINKSITDRSDELLDAYLKDIAKIPMISSEEEIKLAERIQKGDIKARNELVAANLRFVVSVAKQYQGLNIPLMDLINEGNAGLCEAANRFNIQHNCKFISYAVWWIRQSITQALFNDSRTIRIPVSQTAFYNKIVTAEEKFEKENERKPSTKELAKLLKTSEAKINEILLGGVSCTSMDATVTSEDDSCTLGELLPNKNIKDSDYFAYIEDKIINVKNLLNKFPEREQDILRMFYGLEGVQPLSYEEIGKRFGLTGERIRQINNNLISEIKEKYLDLAKELL